VRVSAFWELTGVTNLYESTRVCPILPRGRRCDWGWEVVRMGAAEFFTMKLVKKVKIKR